MAFDPDKYLEEKEAESKSGAFNPDAYLASKEEQPPKETMGALEALLRGGAESLSLGFAPAITGGLESLLTEKPYEQAREESRAAYEKAREEQPAAYYGGAIGAGLAAAPFMPAAAGVKGAALLGARLGAIQGAGTAVSSGGELSDIIGSAGLGAGLGGLTGGATAKLFSMLKPEAVKEVAAERAISALKGAKGQIKQLRSAPTMAPTSKDRLIETGQRLLDQTDYLETPIITPLASAETISERLQVLKDKAGKSIGETLWDLDKGFSQISDTYKHYFNPQTAAKAIEELQKELVGGTGQPLNITKAAYNTLQDAIEDLNSYGNNPVPFVVANKIKKIFSEAAYNAKGTPLEPSMVKARGVVNDLIENAADLVAEKSGRPALATKYLQDKDLYRTAIDSMRMVDETLARHITNRDLGITDYMVGAAGMAAHGTPTGIAAAGANKFLRTYGNTLAATGSKKMSQALDSDIMRALNQAFTKVPEGMKTMGDKLISSGSPAKVKLGQILIEAADKDDIGRNAIMFSLMQNSMYRDLLKSTVKDEYERH